MRTDSGSFVPLRLRPGDDLRAALEAAAAPGESAYVLAGIGSLVNARLRFADRREAQTVPGPLEIVSVAGTLSPDGAHLHMSVSDDAGREPDPDTDYDELVVRRRTGGR